MVLTMSISCLSYVTHNVLDACNCNCANAQSMHMPEMTSREECEQSCTSQSWCVMYSYVPDCVLYSHDEPCETCNAVGACSSGCLGRATYLKRECDTRRLSSAAEDPPSPPPPLDVSAMFTRTTIRQRAHDMLRVQSKDAADKYVSS